MPQNGFHGLVGLAAARPFARRLPAELAPAGVAATVLGAMLPDIDMYPTAVAFLLGRKDLIYVIHRSATHSLSLALVLAFFALVFWRRKSAAGVVGAGLTIGVLTHIGLDLFFWFAQIDLFWPFSHLPPESPIAPVADLWKGVTVPPILVNIREAFEFAAFGLLLMALRRTTATPSLIKWERAAWAFFGIALVTAVLFRDHPSWQNYVVTTPYLLAFLPFCWRQVVVVKTELARWAVRAS